MITILQKGRTPFIGYVPGKGATDFYTELCGEAASQKDHFYHEEIAYTAAHGAALSGALSLLFIKSHGLAKAMNSVIASLHSTQIAPMLVFVFDDSLGKSSDHPFSAGPTLKVLGADIFESKEEFIDQKCLNAAELSYEKGRPVFLTLDVSKDFRTKGFSAIFEQLKIQTQKFISSDLSGKRLENNLHRCLNPLLSPRFFNSEHKAPTIPENLPPVLRSTAESYVRTIQGLQTLNYDWVTGDAGTSSLFALPPFYFTQACTHMGGSIPLALGATLSGMPRVLATVGDFSFLSTGCLALSEALRRKARFDVVLFRNGVASATGGQVVNKEDLLRQIPMGCEIQSFNVSEDNGVDKLTHALNNKPQSVRIMIAEV